ncbi:MAG TPA: ABC transporter ATP-binding protein [Acetobacteraceae bacterium]|jgi:ABC-type Fe3+/spermidine/putrescine transport system ATPase subunit|nr:ABC transporter ATP-binding protein [Acetobacteraceae bacterium]
MNVALPIVSAPPQQDAGQADARRHLEVDRVWKSYTAGVHVVRDVSFTLAQGEFLTLLGPSGSGKTSTLMMVAGFEAPSRGAIRVDGRDVAQLPPERRNFGVVFQGYALFPHMTVLENVAFPLRMKGLGGAVRRRAAMEMLDKVGLAEFAARRPHALSGGQQQRVALARALVFEPDALLLDEPLGALDRKLREALQVEIKDIQRRVGVSILFVTHDQDEAMMMSDRIAVMQEGRIAQLGAPDEVYLHPETPFVAGFLGETNLLRGQCLAQQDGYAVVRFAGDVIGPARVSRGGAPPCAGAAVLASIRPERIRLLRTDETAAGVIQGVVADRVFLGRHTRLTVQAPGQTLIVSTAEPPPASVVRGTTVRLGWSREDAQMLNETGEATG